MKAIQKPVEKSIELYEYLKSKTNKKIVVINNSGLSLCWYDLPNIELIIVEADDFQSVKTAIWTGLDAQYDVVALYGENKFLTNANLNELQVLENNYSGSEIVITMA